MLFDYLIAIVAQKLAFVSLLEIWKKLKNWKFFQKSKFFKFSIFFFKFQGDLQKRVFKLRLQSGSQKASKLLRQFIGKHYMSVRAVARALRAKKEDSSKPDFHTFLQYRWARARNRARAHLVRANGFS